MDARILPVEDDPSIEEVDLGRLVAAVVAARLPDAVVTVPAGPVLAATDPGRLGKILGRLLDNTECAPGAPVEVSLAATRDGAVITVADRGHGIPASALPRHVDRSATTEPARSGGASGTSIAAAADDASSIGAALRLRARPGGGLVLKLVVPAARTTGSLPLGDPPDDPVADA